MWGRFCRDVPRLCWKLVLGAGAACARGWTCPLQGPILPHQQPWEPVLSPGKGAGQDAGGFRRAGQLYQLCGWKVQAAASAPGRPQLAL